MKSSHFSLFLEFSIVFLVGVLAGAVIQKTIGVRFAYVYWSMVEQPAVD